MRTATAVAAAALVLVVSADALQMVGGAGMPAAAPAVRELLTKADSSARATEPAGVVARICPVCATKYDLNARFCGHDAGELVVIN